MSHLTSIVGVGLLGLLLATRADSEEVARITESHAVKVIEAAGGVVTRSELPPGTPGVSISGFKAPMDDATIDAIASLNDVQALDLSRTDLTDAQLKRLGQLPAVRMLNLDRTNVSDAGLTALSGMPNLEDLDLTLTRTSDDGLKLLAPLTKLRVLAVNWGTTEAGFDHLKALPNLQTLVLSGTRVKGNSLSHLANLPALRAIDLSCNGEVTDVQLKQLALVRNLQRLDLFCHVSDAGIKELSGLEKLTHLSIRGFGHTITGQGLSQLRKLEVLEIYHMEIEVADLKGLNQLPALTTISLGGRFTDGAFDELRSIRSLRELKLQWSRLGPDVVEAFRVARPEVKMIER